MAKSKLDVNEPLNLPEPKIGLVDDTTEPNKSEAVVEPEPEDPKAEEPEPKEPDIPATPGPDPFDLSKYRINPAAVQANGVRKMRVTVPVRKPNAQEWFRVHPASHYRMDLPMITLKEDREEYLVNPAIWPALASEVTPVTLFTCVNRQGVVFLWPVKLPTPDGRRSEWIISSRTAAETAMEKWARLKANMDLGAYEIHVAEGIVAEPLWPEETLDALVQIAFRGRIINGLDHHVVDRLHGKA